MSTLDILLIQRASANSESSYSNRIVNVYSYICKYHGLLYCGYHGAAAAPYVQKDTTVEPIRPYREREWCDTFRFVAFERALPKHFILHKYHLNLVTKPAPSHIHVESLHSVCSYYTS